MEFTVGTRVGSYEVKSRLGEGGMGVVFRALDTKLQRDVALKLLPDRFAADEDRLSRFLREAQLLATLNNPNIAQVYGLEDSGNTRCIVMELVEGETLQQRLTCGPIPVAEAVEIAREMAQALEAAHERGVIHRDLKPGNVMLTTDGKVKVLDFGLATIAQASGASGDFSNSPTLFSASGGGVLLGTAPYMSPEQARGKAVDRRTDVWAFGCVLYEMLTGDRLFGGETISDSIAKVLEREPDWTKVANVPPSIQRLLRRCLQKNANRRLRDMGDLRLELEEIDQAPASVSTVPAATVHRSGRVWIAAALLFLITSLMFAVLYFRSRPVSPGVVQMSVLPPPGTNFATGASATPSVSPDGKSIAFIAASDTARLWIRPIASMDARAVEGSENADSPFWSPDSQWIAFFAKGKLWRAAVSGGKAQVICPVVAAGRSSGTWNHEGTIVFGLDTGLSLSRVSAEGGPVTPVTVLDASREDGAHLRPQFLPDEKHFLFLIRSPKKGGSGVYVGSLDSREVKPVLMDTGTPAYYVPSGHLVFLRNGTLFAQKFNVRTFQLEENPIHLVDAVFYGTGNAFGSFSISENGVLAYRTGGDINQSQQSQLTWFDRSGKKLGVLGGVGLNRNPRLSPDGTRAVVQIIRDTASSASWAIWVLGPGTTSSRLVDEAVYPVWSSDNAVIYLAFRGDKVALLQKSLVPGAEEKTLYRNWSVGHLDDVSADGQYFIESLNTGVNLRDVLAVPLDPAQKPIPIATTPANEIFGRVSPDGHWVAFTSEETVKSEVYLQPFPRAAGKIQVSREGGTLPVWRRDGKELFYISPDKKLMAVRVSGGAVPTPGTPESLFEVHVTNGGGIGTPSKYDVTPDGQRFLINTALSDVTDDILSPIHVILNWPELLKR